MAIIQISQIKHRRGNRLDLPNSLEEGEIGLALDSGEVFIGTPNLPQVSERVSAGTFPFGNTQLLTEWTDNIEEMLNYQYRARKVLFDSIQSEFEIQGDTAKPILSYLNSNNVSISTVVSRKLQERLDDIVSVKAYGATGNARKDFSVLPSQGQMNAETAALRTAALDATNVSNNPGADAEWKPKALHYPAGVYAINDSLFLPPESTWLGDGKGNTVIALAAKAGSNPTQGFNDCLLFTVDGGLQPEDIDNNATIGQHSYGTIGTAVSAGSDILPENIFVTGITFVIQRDDHNTATPHDIIRLIAARNVIFYDCEFIGNWGNMPEVEAKGTNNAGFYVGGTLGAGNEGDSIGVVIDSYNNMIDEFKSRNISFINCDFSNTAYASLITDDMRNISFSMCKFNRHYRAIAVAEPLAAPFVKTITQGSLGPRFVTIDRNYFANIKEEAISVNSVGLINERDDATIEFFGAAGVISTFNRFENVGNGDTNSGSLDFSVLNPVALSSPIIRFRPGTMNNASIGDSFSRDSIPEKTGGVYGITIPRIESSPLDSNLVINSQDFQSNPVRQLVLQALMTNTTGLRFAQSSNNTVFVNYTLVKDGTNDKRIGTMRIIGTDAPGVFLDDDYSEVGTPIDVAFNVTTDGTTISLEYINNDAVNLILYYQFNNWTTVG